VTPPSDLATTRSGKPIAVMGVWSVAVTPSVPSWAVTMMVKVSATGGVHLYSYVLLPAVEATRPAVSVNVVETTVPPEEFLMTRSALVMSEAPNGSLTVKRTNAGWPATVVVKGVESPERLLDETALFLHRVVAELPEEKQKLLSRLHGTDDYLLGRKVLLVDDDARNIFALSSLLERRGMQVLTATTGLEAIETLSSTDVSIVLMDIMMPEMDGYQTMQRIRNSGKHQRLPIIALTAKAMKGDREKCLEAGASDYLAKPVDTDQLLSALRMWLHR